MDAKQEADNLRKEAKDILYKMLNLPDGFGSEKVDRFVDCVILAAMLEIVDTMGKAADKPK